ncbi:MAG: acyl carrier protein [Crocinitomicaceae bacterium]|jgi:acyl carrier protein
MMTLEEFVIEIEDAFEIQERGTLLPDTDYKNFEEWDSMHALILIALIDTEFDLLVSGNDLKNLVTVREVYQLIQDRKSV